MEKKGSKTLLMSVIMSAPGPLVLGIGLMMGKSNTQIADFIRRSIELLAIIASFVAYQISIKRSLSAEQEKRLEKNTNLFVGAVMFLAGAIMLFVTLSADKGYRGNVLFSLVIAILGVMANSFFWIRYTRLYRSVDNSIFEVQARLYGAKSLVDICVTSALLAVMLAPMSQASYYLDIFGSTVVSLYLAYSGIKIILEKSKA